MYSEGCHGRLHNIFELFFGALSEMSDDVTLLLQMTIIVNFFKSISPYNYVIKREETKTLTEFKVY